MNEWVKSNYEWIVYMNECAIWATEKKMMNENQNDQQMRKTQIFSYLSSYKASQRERKKTLSNYILLTKSEFRNDKYWMEYYYFACCYHQFQ